MSHLPIEDTDVFRVFDELSDELWNEAVKWPSFAQEVLGKQLVRALDSVGANLVEGDGRYSDAEAIHFFEYARGSARESRFFIRKAMKRNLVGAAIANGQVERIESGSKMLNSLINYRRRTKNVGAVRERGIEYLPNAQRQSPNASPTSFLTEEI